MLWHVVRWVDWEATQPSGTCSCSNLQETECIPSQGFTCIPGTPAALQSCCALICLSNYVHAIPFARSALPCISLLRSLSSPLSPPSLTDSQQGKQSASLIVQVLFSSLWVTIRLYGNCHFAYLTDKIMKLWKNLSLKWIWRIWNGESHVWALRRMELKSWETDFLLYAWFIEDWDSSPDQWKPSKNLPLLTTANLLLGFWLDFLPLAFLADKCSLSKPSMDSPVACYNMHLPNCNSFAISE